MLTAITDESGETVATFDLSRAAQLATTRRHNGSNWDSRWVNLLRTAKGVYVTEHESQWQEEPTFYRLANPNEAARFLARWRQGDDPDVPTDLQEDARSLGGPR